MPLLSLLRQIPQYPAVRACACSAACHVLAMLSLAMVLVGERRAGDGPAILAQTIERAESPILQHLQQSPPETVFVTRSPHMVQGLTASAMPARVSVDDLALLAAVGEPAEGVLGALGESLPAGSLSAEIGPGRSANFYGIEAGGDDFVFVVDMSGSMTGSRFRRARGELRRSLESLGPSQRYYIIFFNSGAYPMPANDLLEASEENLRDTLRWIKQVQCQGFTNPLAALLRALDLEPDAIFLLTDGQFDPQVAASIAEARTGDAIPIHTIGFTSREGEPMLRAISQVTGGTYRYVR